ncbi:hypothetical protein BDY19DRAFT_994368 [Irpex rosettiformis]|uniref:Uncharacterized protein n=1 Tax=Irpex rosettiformis TaxID=378272 RepID=A0ACB8U1R6_9APHY|nr:hypothetical protein BDY19DRAFT_994368 [Irpex rosettiformis]
MPNFFSRLRRWLLPFRARASIERQHAEPENTSVEVISAHSPAASSEHRRLHSQNNMKLQEDIPAQPAVVAMSDADLAKYSPGYSSPSPAYGGYSPIGAIHQTHPRRCPNSQKVATQVAMMSCVSDQAEEVRALYQLPSSIFDVHMSDCLCSTQLKECASCDRCQESRQTDDRELCILPSSSDTWNHEKDKSVVHTPTQEESDTIFPACPTQSRRRTARSKIQWSRKSLKRAVFAKPVTALAGTKTLVKVKPLPKPQEDRENSVNQATSDPDTLPAQC